MTSYSKATNFAAKDALLTGNPSKVVKGTEIDAEFTAIQAADATSLKNGEALGTPSGGTLTNCTGLPVSTGISGLGTGVATFLATPSSANLASAVTGETGSGALVFATSPTLVTPALGTPASGTLTNCTGLPSTGFTFLQAGTGATSRTGQAKLRDEVSAKDFGATGDGTTDDTAALQAAIDAVSAAGGGVVLLPPGIYQTSGITLKAGVTLQGYGAYASIIRTTSATATVVAMLASSVLCGVKLLSTPTRTSGYYVDVQDNSAIIDNCEFVGYYIGINVGTIGGSLIVNTLVKDCEFRTPETGLGSGGVQFINFSNAVMRNCLLTGPSLPGTQPTFGVRYQNGDTAFLSECNITVHGKALLIDPGAASNAYSINIASCVFDSAGSISGGSNVSSAEIIPAGGVYDTRISNSWFGLSQNQSGCSMSPSGAGVIDGITFTGCQFTDNGDCGLLVVGSGVKNWMVTGGHSGGNANQGIKAAGSTSYFTITGHRAGNIAGRGANNYGIFVVNATTSDYFTISDCNLIGNTTAGLFDGSTGTSARVTNNLGYNGETAAIGVTVGASPYTYTAGHSPETLYIAGGTVSSVSIDGTTVLNATGASITLPPNKSAVITYSSLPTIIKKLS